MSIFDWFKRKKILKTAMQGREARQKFKALPISLSQPKQDRVAQRLMRLYQTTRVTKDVIKSREACVKRLKELSVAYPPVNRVEAEALVAKIKKDRQEK